MPMGKFITGQKPDNQATWFEKTPWPDEAEGLPTVQDTIDLAQSHLNYVLTQPGARSEYGVALVAVMWDPTTSVFWASTVPRGQHLHTILEGLKAGKAKPWAEAAKYTKRSDRIQLMHAEDNIEFAYCIEMKDNIKDGKFPDKSFMVAYIDHGPTFDPRKHGAPIEVYAPCAPNDGRPGGWGCRDTALALNIIPWDSGITNIQLDRLPRPLPKTPPRIVTDDNVFAMFGGSPTSENFDDSLLDQVGYSPPSNDRRRGVSGHRLFDSESDARHAEAVLTRPHDTWQQHTDAVPAHIRDENSTPTSNYTSTLTTVSGAPLMDIDGRYYWSLTFTMPTVSSGFTLPTVPVITAEITPSPNDFATAIGSSPIASSMTFTGDPPCTYSADPDAGDDGACVCTNDATISVSSSDGQPCPWTTLPAQALAHQAATTAVHAAIKSAPEAGIGLPTTLVTQTA